MRPESPPTCAKCGACSTVCPVYRVSGREYHTGRGKLHLLARLDPATASAAYADILSRCLLCGACSAVCPRNIPVAEELAAARARLSRRAGEQVLLRRLAGGLLTSPRLLKLLAPLARRCNLAEIPASSGLHLRLGLHLRQGSERPPASDPEAAVTIESIPDATLRQDPDPLAPGNGPAGQFPALYLFAGCYGNYLDPTVKQAVNSLLSKTGCSPPRPAEAACCGLAAHSSGSRAEARRLARLNIAAHPGPAPIVVSCASCAAHLSRYPELLADDERWRERAKEFAVRVKEFCQFFHQAAPEQQGIESGSKRFRSPSADSDSNAKPSTSPSPSTDTGSGPGHLPDSGPGPKPGRLKVLYHDPCHLRFALKISAPPRQLLARLPGVELVELPHGPRCCGQGGLFHLAHPTEARAIMAELAADFRASGAAVVTSSCSGCLLHWQKARNQKLHQGQVIHLALLLDQLT